MIRQVLLLLLIGLLVACGGGDEGTPAAQDSAPTATFAPLPIEPRDYTLGPDDAPVIVVMYGDFQCQLCARYARDLESIRADYADDVQLVWRHFPDVAAHDKSALALQAAEAAAAQNRFWEMQAVLYTTQAEWGALSPEAFRLKLNEYAASVGLDLSAFDAALDDGRYAPLVEQYQQQAAELGIVGVPTLVINGELLSDRDDRFGLEGAIRLALLGQHHFSDSPPFTIDLTANYQAVIETERGDIRIDLLEKVAPVTVNNFVFLAEAGWYDDMTFFLVIPDFYAQTGDPSDTGRGNAGYFIPNESTNDVVAFDRPGLVAMSYPPGQPDNASSQFFITTAELPNRQAEWDGQYTIFGEVIEGLDVVRSLMERNPGDPERFPNPEPGDRVETVRIEIVP